MQINQMTAFASRHKELKSKCYQLNKEQATQFYNIINAVSIMLYQLKTKTEGTPLAGDTLMTSYTDKNLWKHVDELKTILKCHLLNIDAQASLFDESEIP